MTDPGLLPVLVGSTLAQTSAVLIALRQMSDVSGHYRLAWGCVTLALALMVQRRLAPLWRFVTEGTPTPLADAWFGLAISVSMAVGIFGIRRLFIDMKKQETALYTLARTDVLTGLPNRREILARLQSELDRSERSRHPVSVLMLDVDHFKKVNDTYGHAAGDQVLQAVAQAANACLRRIDSCGRIGGEEFLVVLPEADSTEATAVAERLRTAIEGLMIIAEAHTVRVTTSIGIALLPAGETHPSPESLIQRADNALYVAKEGGRNRVVLA